MSNPTSDQSKSPFPSVRRVVTGHTPSGEAIVLRDEVIKPEFWAPESRDAVHNVYQSDETPARNDAEVNKGEEGGWVDVIGSRTGPEFLVSKGGSTIRSFDLAPGSVSVSAFNGFGSVLCNVIIDFFLRCIYDTIRTLADWGI